MSKYLPISIKLLPEERAALDALAAAVSAEIKRPVTLTDIVRHMPGPFTENRKAFGDLAKAIGAAKVSG